MREERITAEDPRMQSALTELKGLITKHYPDAAFEVSEGDDPEGVYLTATVDIEDMTEVLDIIGERVVDLEVEEGLPLYVIPVRPLEREIAALRANRRYVGDRPFLGGGALLTP